ncbi:MAG: hypothetical protein ACI8PZ_004641 [Myxococcota bacterium]|jgi:hypothetical protein
MRSILALVGTLFALPALAGGPLLAVSGTCPGPAVITVDGVSPGASVAILAGGPGSDAVPGGPCADTRTDLSRIRYITTLRDADRDGSVSVAPSLPVPACGRSLQVLDLSTCAVSNVVVVPTGEEVELELTPASGGVVGGEDPYWADKGYVFTADSTFAINGGSWLIDVPPDGIVRMSVYDWPGLGLLARGTSAPGTGSEDWMRSDLAFTFLAGSEYLVTFYTDRAGSSVFTRKDGPSYGYAVDGLISGVTGWSSSNAGDDAPEGTDAGGYLGNSWAPYEVLHVVE